MSQVSTDDPASVFINCPFTADYRELLEATIFTVLACGLRPRSALEASDGGDSRLEKIVRLIRESRFSIHDISMVDLDDISGLPRFNMPFELGIVVGCKKLGGQPHASKSLLILESVKYTYQKCLSDISGQDAHAHGHDPMRLIQIVRDWLRTESQRNSLPGGKAIGKLFALFSADLPGISADGGLDRDELPYVDFIGFAQAWLLEANPLEP